MKKKLIIISIIIVLLILFVPIKVRYKDGGTVEYKSLTYRIFKWNRLLSDGSHYVATDIYYFPNNFHEFEYYAPIIAPIVTLEYNNTTFSVDSYSYHWSKNYKDEVRYDIADGNLEDVEFDKSFLVDSNSEIDFITDYFIEDVEYAKYNEEETEELIFNGLSYNQETKKLIIPELESGSYLLKFKLYDEEDNYAMYALLISIQDEEMNNIEQ